MSPTHCKSTQRIQQQFSVDQARSMAVPMPRAGLFVALLLWSHTLPLRVSAYCPGFSVNTRADFTAVCDGSRWSGPFCCAVSNGGGYDKCLSTSTYEGNYFWGTFSEDIKLLIDATAGAILESTSVVNFCKNVRNALDNTGLPTTNACLQENLQALEGFGCSGGRSGI